MKASEAREISEVAMAKADGPVIGKYVTAITEKIKKACSEGMVGIYLDYIPREARKSVYSHFRSLGYDIEDHPDPDPGHPASRPYTTLSW